MNPYQTACFFDDDPGSGIGYRKDPLFGFEAFVSDVSLKPFGALLGQEGGLRFLSADKCTLR
jgi:hypothetical protein